MLSRFFWMSMAGNIFLAIFAYFLFSTNSKLTNQNGQQSSTISGYKKNETIYQSRERACVGTQKSLIASHTLQIKAIKALADQKTFENRKVIENLLREQIRIKTILVGIKEPERYADAQKRLDAISVMVDNYIKELKK